MPSGVRMDPKDTLLMEKSLSVTYSTGCFAALLLVDAPLTCVSVALQGRNLRQAHQHHQPCCFRDWIAFQ